MKVVCSMLVFNELDNHLERAVASALEWCDEVRALDNDSTDGSYEALEAADGVVVKRSTLVPWASEGGHEGQTRQELLDHVLAGEPDYVVPLDADEVVPDGPVLRQRMEADPWVLVWALRVVEMWAEDPWRIRVDGKWPPRWAPVIWKTSARTRWTAYDLRLACPREPQEVAEIASEDGQVANSNCDLCHLGWLHPETRESRAARYELHDAGNFHVQDHLDSILWPADKIKLEKYTGPPPW